MYDIRFLLQVTSDADIVINEESKELRWVSKDRTTWPPVNGSVMRMFNKWLSISLDNEKLKP